MMSSAEAPIIWSITNGSELMKNVPPPKPAAGNEMHIMTKAGIFQSNCSMTNDIKMNKYATVIRKLPAVIARYLPSNESLIHPATGSSTNTGMYTGYVFLKLKISEIKLAAIHKRKKLIRALHTRRSVVPRENGLQHFVSVIVPYSISAVAHVFIIPDIFSIEMLINNVLYL